MLVLVLASVYFLFPPFFFLGDHRSGMSRHLCRLVELFSTRAGRRCPMKTRRIPPAAGTGTNSVVLSLSLSLSLSAVVWCHGASSGPQLPAAVTRPSSHNGPLMAGRFHHARPQPRHRHCHRRIRPDNT